MKAILFSLIILFSISTKGQHKKAYSVYTKSGKKSSYNKLVKESKKANIVFFGELHNNPIAHWLQYELTYDLSQSNKIMLGAEMFESNDQLVLNDYLKGTINDKQLAEQANLWPNFKTDYKPILDFAKAKSIPFIATNSPRKYASLVYKGGFEALDTLPANEKEFLAPLPIKYDENLKCYKDIFAAAHGHGSPNLPKAQAIKDATMSYFISKFFTKDRLFIHFNGKYHSDNHQGIVWYLKLWNPELQHLTISTIEKEDVNEFNNEDLGVADFIIYIDKNMTKSY